MIFAHTAQYITGYWRRFTTGSTNRRIFGSILTISIFTIGVKAIAFIKELVIAHDFGTSDTLDAFLVAFVLPTYLLFVLGMPFGGALVPSFVRLMEHNEQEKAQQLLSSITMLLVLILSLMSIVLLAIATHILPFIGSSFDKNKLSLTLIMLVILTPIALLGGLIEIATATLNTMGRFAFTSVSAAIIPATTVVVILIVPTQWDAFAIATSITVGYILQLSLLIWQIRQNGLILSPRWYGWTPDLRRVLTQYWPVVLGSTLHNSSTLIDQAMTTPLGSGSIAALNYGNKLVALIQGVGAAALGTAILPYFARMVAVNDWRGIRSSLKTYTCLIFFVSIPFISIVIVFSHFIVEIVYERGAFNASDTLIVSHIQSMFVLQLPFFALSIMLVQLIISLGATRILMWGTVMNVILNIAFNYILRTYFGVVGIALSTTLVYVASSIYFFVILYRKLNQIDRKTDESHVNDSITPSGGR